MQGGCAHLRLYCVEGRDSYMYAPLLLPAAVCVGVLVLSAGGHVRAAGLPKAHWRTGSRGPGRRKVSEAGTSAPNFSRRSRADRQDAALSTHTPHHATPRHTIPHNMSSRNPPPWERNGRDRPPQRPPPSSTVPAKRSADPRSHGNDNAAKRSTNAAEEAWVADEDRFVLQQAKKKAALRVKGGRAKPIDWLAVTLRFIDPTKTIHDEEVGDHELDVQDPEGVLEGLDAEDLSELEKEIENYLTLETNRGNREYWSVSAAAGSHILGEGQERAGAVAAAGAGAAGIGTDR
jgi:hypothetical protein